MDWTRPVDGYCERVGPAFWSEPVNAVTNAAFLLAALWVWHRLRGMPYGIGHLLCVILGAIGVGSFLFHTFAQPWAGVADVVPIVLFILVYIYAANRDFLTMRPVNALLATAGFMPFAALTIPVFSRLPWISNSAAYFPVPTLILIYALLLRRTAPKTAAGLALGAGILLASLGARIVDDALCPVWPLGTHFLWHILNAIMLGWMILVWRAHILAKGARAG